MIVITGAAGFIGSCLVAYLNEIGNSSLLLADDLKFQDKWKNLCNKKFVDLVSKEDLFNFLKKEKVDAIIHLGACSDTLEKNVDYLLKNNYRYSVELLKIALERDIRFIYASSAATYGDGKNGFSDAGIDNLLPLNAYGFSKHLFDLYVQRNNLLNKVVSLKYFNVFGPNEYHKGHMASMIYKMIQKTQKNEPIELYKSTHASYEDGEQKRDFIYVKDAVKMTSLFLDSKKNGIFNIGSGVAISWNIVAKALFKALNKDPNIKYIDMPKDLCEQYQNYTCADMSKFQSIYKYRCLDIEDSIKDYVQNYLLYKKIW